MTGALLGNSRTVYLDTAIWYDLADGRTHAPVFEEAVRAGRLTPVLSFTHLMEFALSKGNSYQTVINYIEALRQSHSIAWIKNLPTVAALELRQRFLISYGIRTHPFSVFTETFVDTLNQTVRGLDRAEARTYDMTTLVSTMGKIREFRRYAKLRRTGALLDIFEPQFRRARSSKGRPPLLSAYLRNILAGMPQRFTTDAGLVVEITPQAREEFLRSLKWEQLPAISLRLAITNGWSQLPRQRKTSDFGDLFHIAVPLAYCDVTFTDRRAYAALNRGGAIKLPKRNSDFLTWCNELNCGSLDSSSAQSHRQHCGALKAPGFQFL